MVYHPYFRGKQFELGAIRETADILASAGFTPIIEPVREQVRVLRRTLDLLCEKGVTAVLIVNPQIGDHTTNQAGLNELLGTHYAGADNIIPGILATAEMSPADVVQFCGVHDGRDVAILHSGMGDAAALAAALANVQNDAVHVFLPESSGKLYIRHFAARAGRTLVNDGFKAQAAN